MKTKDFKVGQKVYIYDSFFNEVKQDVVVKVGWIYVYVGDTINPDRFYVKDESDNHLYEQAEFGQRRQLFVSEEAITDEKMREALINYLDNRFRSRGGKRYSLDQLKRIAEITKE